MLQTKDGAYQEVKCFGCYYDDCFVSIEFKLRRHEFKVYYGIYCQQIMLLRLESKSKRQQNLNYRVQ